MKCVRINKIKVLIAAAKKDWLQKDLAEATGMTKGNLSTIINGKNCNARTVVRIAKALDVDIKEILEDE